MADVVIASDDLVVLGGPSSITLQLDVGAVGARGSQIFTDVSKPNVAEFPFPPQINDLFINLNPSDSDYLFLYQYKLDNAVLGWTKLLRLIPTTILFNPVLKFINGEAHTSIFVEGLPSVDLRGLYFPISGTLENENIEGLDVRDLNVQYAVNSDKVSATSVELVGIDTSFDVEIWNPVTQSYDTQEDRPFNARFLFAKLKVAEFSGSPLAASYINGYRKVDMVLTIAGRSTAVLDVSGVTVANPSIQSPGFLVIPNHGMKVGQKFGYLANGNTPIAGLTNQADYYVAVVPNANSIIITADGTNPITFTNASFSGTHSIVRSGGFV